MKRLLLAWVLLMVGCESQKNKFDAEEWLRMPVQRGEHESTRPIVWYHFDTPPKRLGWKGCWKIEDGEPVFCREPDHD